ncbi:hypothetical protein [Bordetella bronchiseptica]|nr:hypothetical protein [Bordetella bronchiseptica]
MIAAVLALIVANSPLLQ